MRRGKKYFQCQVCEAPTNGRHCKAHQIYGANPNASRMAMDLGVTVRQIRAMGGWARLQNMHPDARAVLVNAFRPKRPALSEAKEFAC